MLCDKCGHKIPDNSSFCNYCGTKQKPKDNEDDDNVIKYLSLKIIIPTLVVAVLIFIISAALIPSIDKIELPELNIGINNADNSDIMVEFVSIPRILESDDYYMLIQAQEKIENLKIEVKYLSSSGRVLKTETIDVGKVVPGNEYRIELSQSGMDFDDIDKTSKISYRVVGGTIKK